MRFLQGKKRGCASSQACVFLLFFVGGGGVLFWKEIGVCVRIEGEIKETRVDEAAAQYCKACFSFKIRLQELTGIMVHVTRSWMCLFYFIYFCVCVFLFP